MSPQRLLERPKTALQLCSYSQSYLEVINSSPIPPRRGHAAPAEENPTFTHFVNTTPRAPNTTPRALNTTPNAAPELLHSNLFALV